MKMKFSVGMGGELRTDQVADHARVVEDSGFDYLTLVDSPASSRDVHVMTTLAAMATNRIRIGQGVVDPMTIHPSVIANISASIDELSGGRAFIGLGTGNPISKHRRPARLRELREAVRFIRSFMSGEEAEFNGVRSHSRWITSPLPIYISAHGPKAMQLAGEVADGVISLCVHQEYVKWQLRQVEKGALRAGRDPSEIDTWARCMVYVAESKEAARRETSAYPSSYKDLHRLLSRDDPDVEDLRASLERSEPGLVEELIRDSKSFADAMDPELAERVDAPHSKVVTQRLIDFYHLSGTPDEICERIQLLGELGVKTISMTVYTIIDKKRMIREVGDKIIPQFRA